MARATRSVDFRPALIKLHCLSVKPERLLIVTFRCGSFNSWESTDHMHFTKTLQNAFVRYESKEQPGIHKLVLWPFAQRRGTPPLRIPTWDAQNNQGLANWSVNLAAEKRHRWATVQRHQPPPTVQKETRAQCFEHDWVVLTFVSPSLEHHSTALFCWKGNKNAQQNPK